MKVNKEAFKIEGNVLSGKYIAYFKTDDESKVLKREYRDFDIYNEEIVSADSI